MKKAIGPLLCLALCLALAACGGEAQSTASSTHAALPGGGRGRGGPRFRRIS